jgi:hypothetical protein
LYRESQAPPKKSKAKGKGKRGAAKKKAPPPPPVRRGTRRGLRSAPEDPPEEDQAPEEQVEEEDEEWMPWKMVSISMGKPIFRIAIYNTSSASCVLRLVTGKTFQNDLKTASTAMNNDFISTSREI